MSPVDVYLDDLRVALDDRLPPEVAEARLREARGHLLIAADEEGETEAVRRYGRPRAIANDLVRSYRGYDTRSVWRLALPLIAGRLLFLNGDWTDALWRNGGVPVPFPALELSLWTLLAFAFVARVVQTRRWLAGPMIAGVALNMAITLAIVHLYPFDNSRDWKQRLFYRHRVTLDEKVRLVRHSSDGNTPQGLLREAASFAPIFGMNAEIWLILNAATLGLAALSDRRRVRRAAD